MSLDTVLGQLVSLAVASFFGMGLSFFITGSKRYKCTQNAIYSLIKSQIVSEWRRVTQQGFVYIHDLDAINELYAQYLIMGGNGSVKLLMEDIRNLKRVVIGDPIDKQL